MYEFRGLTEDELERLFEPAPPVAPWQEFRNLTEDDIAAYVLAALGEA